MCLMQSHSKVAMIIIILTVITVKRTDGSPAESILILSKSSRYCLHSGTTLACNMKGVSQPVHLDSSLDVLVKKVYVYNAHTLYIDPTVCANISINNVSQTHVLEQQQSDAQDPDGTCNQLGISLNNVTVDFLPPTTRSLHAEKSHIKQLHFHKLQEGVHFNFSSSTIDSIKIENPINFAIIYFSNSRIRTLEKMEMTLKSKLFLHNTEIDSFTNALVIGNTSTVFFSGEKVLNLTQNRIVLEPGSFVTISNYLSKISFEVKSNLNKNIKEIHFSSGQNTINETCPDCLALRVVIGILVVCVIILLTVMVFLIYLRRVEKSVSKKPNNGLGDRAESEGDHLLIKYPDQNVNKENDENRQNRISFPSRVKESLIYKRKHNQTRAASHEACDSNSAPCVEIEDTADSNSCKKIAQQSPEAQVTQENEICFVVRGINATNNENMNVVNEHDIERKSLLEMVQTDLATPNSSSTNSSIQEELEANTKESSNEDTVQPENDTDSNVSEDEKTNHVTGTDDSKLNTDEDNKISSDTNTGTYCVIQ